MLGTCTRSVEKAGIQDKLERYLDQDVLLVARKEDEAANLCSVRGGPDVESEVLGAREGLQRRKLVRTGTGSVRRQHGAHLDLLLDRLLRQLEQLVNVLADRLWSPRVDLGDHCRVEKRAEL